jgi:hypothetical protein
MIVLNMRQAEMTEAAVAAPSADMYCIAVLHWAETKSSLRDLHRAVFGRLPYIGSISHTLGQSGHPGLSARSSRLFHYGHATLAYYF